MHKPKPKSWRGIEIITKYVEKDFVGELLNRHLLRKGTVSDSAGTWRELYFF